MSKNQSRDMLSRAVFTNDSYVLSPSLFSLLQWVMEVGSGVWEEKIHHSMATHPYSSTQFSRKWGVSGSLQPGSCNSNVSFLYKSWVQSSFPGKHHGFLPHWPTEFHHRKSYEQSLNKYVEFSPELFNLLVLKECFYNKVSKLFFQNMFFKMLAE